MVVKKQRTNYMKILCNLYKKFESFTYTIIFLYQSIIMRLASAFDLDLDEYLELM